jgi:hypothetical protein
VIPFRIDFFGVLFCSFFHRTIFPDIFIVPQAVYLFQQRDWFFGKEQVHSADNILFLWPAYAHSIQNRQHSLTFCTQQLGVCFQQIHSMMACIANNKT